MRTESKSWSRESLLPSSKGKGQVESLVSQLYII